MKLYCIASGSSGNCVYAEEGQTSVLIDAGVTAKRIEQGLAKGNCHPFSGILITHEHIDHVRGLEVLLKHFPVPVYGTFGTLSAVSGILEKCGLKHLLNPIVPGTSFRLGDLDILPVSTSHDAADPVFYVIFANEKKLSVATDLGCYNDSQKEIIAGSDVIYIESNYDYGMLMAGSYPYSLKRRIAGEHGHLSNECAAELVKQVLHPGLRYVVLAHMSKENNYAELAFENMRQAVNGAWTFENEPPKVIVANRDIPTDILEF